MKQACAACGQVILMKNFMKSFEKRKKKLRKFYLLFLILRIEKKALILERLLINY